MKVKNTTVNKITDYICKEIMYGNIKSEEHLKESKIAKLFGVSRVPVRESLRILQSEGFVILIPNRGSFVRKISSEYITEISKVYILIAPEILQNAIPKYTESTFKKAYVAISKIEKCKEAYKIGYLLWDFAKIIFSPTDLKFMYSIKDEMYKHNIRILNDLFDMRQQKHIFDLRPHKKFLDLCKKKKKNEAIKVWCDYVNELSENFQKVKANNSKK